MSRIIHPNFTRQQSNQPQDAENRPQETQDTRQSGAAAMESANANYNEARDQFENVFNEALCLSELLDGQRATIDLHLSYSGTIGLASILNGFYERGWQSLDMLDEAWSARSGGNE